MPGDDERRGLALKPTRGPLLAALREATRGDLSEEPATLVDLLADGLREQFELVDGVQPDVDLAGGRASLAVSGSAFGDVNRFERPVAPLLGTGLAVGLETAVKYTHDGRGDYLVIARWGDEAADEPTERESADR